MRRDLDMTARHAIVPAALVFLAVTACHHAPPAVAPTAEQANAPVRTAQLASNDSMQRARERADSLRLAREADARALAAARAMLTQSILFDFDRSAIRSDQQAAADAKAPILEANASVKIRIEGNADERGSAEYDIALGMRRAAEAKRFLAERGVDASRIETVSFGKERPACTSHEESCWQQNRRDDFKITAGEVNSKSPSSQ